MGVSEPTRDSKMERIAVNAPEGVIAPAKSLMVERRSDPEGVSEPVSTRDTSRSNTPDEAIAPANNRAASFPIAPDGARLPASDCEKDAGANGAMFFAPLLG